MDIESLKNRSTTIQLEDKFGKQLYVGSPVLYSNRDTRQIHVAIVDKIYEETNAKKLLRLIDNKKVILFNVCGRFNPRELVLADMLLDSTEIAKMQKERLDFYKKKEDETNNRIRHNWIAGLYIDKENNKNVGKFVVKISSKPGKILTKVSAKSQAETILKKYSDRFYFNCFKGMMCIDFADNVKNSYVAPDTSMEYNKNQIIRMFDINTNNYVNQTFEEDKNIFFIPLYTTKQIDNMNLTMDMGYNYFKEQDKEDSHIHMLYSWSSFLNKQKMTYGTEFFDKIIVNKFLNSYQNFKNSK